MIFLSIIGLVVAPCGRVVDQPVRDGVVLDFRRVWHPVAGLLHGLIRVWYELDCRLWLVGRRPVLDRCPEGLFWTTAGAYCRMVVVVLLNVLSVFLLGVCISLHRGIIPYILFALNI